MDPVAPMPEAPKSSGSTALRVVGLFFLVGALIGANYVLASNIVDNKFASEQVAGGEATLTPSLAELAKQNSLSVNQDGELTLDNQLNLQNSAVLNPTTEPSSPVTGQIYLSSIDQKIYYYNGTKFVALVTGETSENIGNTGTPATGYSVQGTSGISLTAGYGILVNGYRITNAGVTKLYAGNGVQVSGVTGDVTIALPQAVGPGNAPTFAGLTLTSPLGVASGGTGASSATGARANLGAASIGANSDITSLSGLTTALSVPQGGTGRTSFAAGGILIGNNTGGIDLITAGNPGYCLMSQGSGAPQFQNCPGGSGTVTAGSPQNTGRLAKFGNLNEIINSRIEESGADVSVYGNLYASNPSNSTTAFVIQDALLNNLLVADTQNMRVTVRNLVISGHLISSGAAPAATVQLNAGTSASWSVVGYDSSGTVTFTTDADVTAGDMCKITFNTPYGAAPKVLLSADNVEAAALQAATTGRTINEFTITSANTPNGPTTYKFNYITIQ